MVIFYGFRSEFACLPTISPLFGSKNVKKYLWLSKKETKKAHQSKKKSKKLKFFKTAQNAVQYNSLVFLYHCMIIFYNFQSEFTCLRTSFTFFGSKNFESYIWLSKRGAKKAHQKKLKKGGENRKKWNFLKLLKTPSNMIFWCFCTILWSFSMVFGRNSLVYERFSLFSVPKTSKVTYG